MANIELVIRVDERDVDLVRKSFKPTGYSFIPLQIQTGFVAAILNGIPIPEGHGKIVDVNELDMTTITTDDYSGNEALECVLKEDIDNAHDLLSTIGADKAKGLEEPEEDMER